MRRLRKAFPILANSSARGTADFFDTEDLHCYGCLHSAAGRPFPSCPSGERPCMFCLRNPDRPDVASFGWYDGTDPIKTPMDAYMSLDMRAQVIRWIEEAAGPSLEEREAVAERLLALRKTVES